MSPRARRDARLPDWYTPALAGEDERLTGTAWRCRSHGVVDDPQHLGGFVYCSRDDCNEQLLLVSRVKNAPKEWNKFVPKAAAAPADQSADEAESGPPEEASDEAASEPVVDQVEQQVDQSPDETPDLGQPQSEQTPEQESHVDQVAETPVEVVQPAESRAAGPRTVGDAVRRFLERSRASTITSSDVNLVVRAAFPDEHPVLVSTRASAELVRQVALGKLVRVDRGVYRRPGGAVDEDTGAEPARRQKQPKQVTVVNHIAEVPGASSEVAKGEKSRLPDAAATPYDPHAPFTLQVVLPDVLARELTALAATGFYGETAAHVAAEMIRGQLCSMLESGGLARATAKAQLA